MNNPLKVSLLNFGDERSHLAALTFQRLGLAVQSVWPTQSWQRALEEISQWQPDFCFSLNLGGWPEESTCRLFHQRLFENKRPHISWITQRLETIARLGLSEYWRNGNTPLIAYVSDRADLNTLGHFGLEARYLPEAADDQVGALNPPAALTQDFRHEIAAYVPQLDLGPKTPLQTPQEFASFFKRASIKIAHRSIGREQPLPEVEETFASFFSDWFSEIDDYAEAVARASKTLQEKTQAPPEIISELISRLEEGFGDFQMALYSRMLSEIGGVLYGGQRWKVWLPGNYPGHCPTLTPIQKRALFKSSRITVSLLPYYAQKKIDPALFTIASLGGFPIVSRRPEIFEFFEPNEVVTYSSPDEFNEKIKYFLRHETERCAISEKLKHKVLAEHTYVHRFRSIIKNFAPSAGH